MKPVWKWVIGIVIVLVIVAALVGGAFLLRAHVAGVVSIARANRPGVQAPGNGKLPGNNGNGQPRGTGRFPGMRPFGNNVWGGRGMHMLVPGMMGFGRLLPFGAIFGCLVSLGFLALIVLGILWLVRKLSKPVAVNAPVVPVAAVAPAEQVAPLAAVHVCPNCGGPVQEGWKHCPHCGKKL